MAEKTIHQAVNQTVASTATIAVSASLSGIVDLNGQILTAIVIPAATEGTSMTFQQSADGTNFYDVYKDDGTEYSITVAASRYIVVDQSKFAGVRWLKVRTGTSGSPTTQSGADAAITLISLPA